MAKIIRIDRGDGSESEVDLDAVARIISDNYKNPELARAEFDAGHRIASSFAYYELREDPEDLEAMAAEADNDAVLEQTDKVLKLKDKLAFARQVAGLAESAYGEVYPQLIAALDAARAKFEQDNAEVVAAFEASKKTLEAADKDLRAALLEFHMLTKQKTFDQHLSIREAIKLSYDIADATKWAREHAGYILVADSKKFEKIAKDTELPFVQKHTQATAVIASSLPVPEKPIELEIVEHAPNVPAVVGEGLAAIDLSATEFPDDPGF